MKQYVSPEIEVTKVETVDIMSSTEVDINVSELMKFDPFAE